MGALIIFRFGGNATGLFCFGEYSPAQGAPVPVELYVHPGSFGYDGQFYFLLAQDPLLRGQILNHLDDTRVRARRILIPAAAHVLAAGIPRFAAYSYCAILLALAGLGTWWLSRLAALRGYPEGWGAIFPLTPAVLVGIERMTVDGALAAMIAGACYFRYTGNWRAMLAILTAAPLIRETGLLLTVAAAVCEWRERRPRRVIAACLTALPFAGWYANVLARTEPSGVTWFGLPGLGILQRIAAPLRYDFVPWAAAILTALDYVALAGVAAAIAISLWRIRRLDFTSLAAGLFALLALSVSNADVWAEVYGFGRTMSPILLLTAAAALDGDRRMTIPMLLVLPRIAAQMAATQFGPLLRPLMER